MNCYYLRIFFNFINKMTENSKEDLVILLEQWQENPENFLNDSENENIEEPTLINYLENINLLYHKNIEKQQIFEGLQLNLDEDIEIINKKMEVYEDKISGNKQKIDKLTIRLNNDKGRLKSFFERLQEDNDQEVSQKKIKFLESEIEELNKVKKKIDQSKDTFIQLENIDYSQRNKNLIIIMTQILKRLETVKFDNLSRNEINTIKQSMTLSDSISNQSISNNFYSYIIKYLSLFIPMLGIFIYYNK